MSTKSREKSNVLKKSYTEKESDEIVTPTQKGFV